MGTFSETLWKARDGAAMSAEEIADEIGVSTSHLYRITDPGGESSFPAQKLIPFMRATRCTEPLRHLAERMGYVLVPRRKLRVPRTPRDEIARRDALQDSANEVLALLRELERCEDLPGKRAAAEQFLEAAHRHAGLTLAICDQVRREPQLDLGLEDH